MFQLKQCKFMFTHTIEEISKVLTNLQTRLDAGDFFDVSNNFFFGAFIKQLCCLFSCP
jgi:hypothetical protein